MVNANQKSFQETFTILNQIGSNQSVVLVLNKIDLMERHKLLAVVETFRHFSQISDVLMISALTGEGVNDLLKWLCHKNARRALALS